MLHNSLAESRNALHDRQIAKKSDLYGNQTCAIASRARRAGRRETAESAVPRSHARQSRRPAGLDTGWRDDRRWSGPRRMCQSVWSGKLGLMQIQTAPDLAADRLGLLGPRWRHARGVGRLAESLAVRGLVSADVLAAAWLHDVGYAPSVEQTGFHPLDGARFLQGQGVSLEVVALVAHHTGARFEAVERGLAEELEALPSPPREDLDALTLIDLVVGPAGELTTPEHRIEEILTRYSSGDPVHRAVTRSQSSLLASAARARSRLGLSDEWPIGAGEGVLEA